MLRHEAEAKLRELAAKDPEFRKKLIADPVRTINETLGLDLPKTLTIRVMEESPNEGILVLPPTFFELSDELLEAAAGGASSS